MSTITAILFAILVRLGMVSADDANARETFNDKYTITTDDSGRTILTEIGEGSTIIVFG